jgi:hypothetical protein
MFMVEVSSTPRLLRNLVTVRRYFPGRSRAWWEFVRVTVMCAPYLRATMPRDISGRAM